MADFVAKLPKTELHVHLEGSVEPETLHELDPETPVEEFRALYSYPDFDGFLKAFGAVSKRLRGPEDYALITRRLLERLEAQNVQYAEIIIAGGVVLWKGHDFGPIFEAVRDAARESAIEVRWIVDAVRQFGVEHVMRVAELAAERVGDGVVAFGIGGSEERGPAEWFGEIFAFAKRAGLRLTAHAGEGTSPESVRAALRLGAERIGHGIAAAQDPELMRELRDRDIPLEICVTSNVVTGAVKRLEDHPVRRLYDAGVPITLNTDDPAMFGCTLTGEYRLAHERFGFSEAELRGIAENGFRYAFGGRIDRERVEELVASASMLEPMGAPDLRDSMDMPDRTGSHNGSVAGDRDS
jgi:adenosine deaminase/aminodeoxyfutalosine deaminase